MAPDVGHERGCLDPGLVMPPRGAGPADDASGWGRLRLWHTPYMRIPPLPLSSPLSAGRRARRHGTRCSAAVIREEAGGEEAPCSLSQADILGSMRCGRARATDDQGQSTSRTEEGRVQPATASRRSRPWGCSGACVGQIGRDCDLNTEPPHRLRTILRAMSYRGHGPQSGGPIIASGMAISLRRLGSRRDRESSGPQMIVVSSPAERGSRLRGTFTMGNRTG